MNREFEINMGKQIRNLRKKQKMTQEALATQLQLRGCDITRSALAKIEVGERHIYADEIYLLKEILKVSYQDLFLFEKET